MADQDRTVQEQLTPEARRGLLRAFADRMLLKVTAMDDPEDMPGVEKAVRVAAVIERIYYRCDRAETQRSDPFKCEAERAHHAEEAVKSRINLAKALQWEDRVRPHYGAWYDAAQTVMEAPAPAPVQPVVVVQKAPSAAAEPQVPTQAPDRREPAEAPAAADTPAEDRDLWNEIPPLPPAGLDYIDRTEDIRRMRAALGLPPVPEPEGSYFAERSTSPP